MIIRIDIPRVMLLRTMKKMGRLSPKDQLFGFSAMGVFSQTSADRIPVSPGTSNLKKKCEPYGSANKERILL